MGTATNTGRSSKSPELFFDDIFEHVVLMGQFGVHLLVLIQLTFQLLELFELIGLHATVLALPFVERRLADPMLPA